MRGSRAKSLRHYAREVATEMGEPKLSGFFYKLFKKQWKDGTLKKIWGQVNEQNNT